MLKSRFYVKSARTCRQSLAFCPLDRMYFNPSFNTTDQARLDIVATGLWGHLETTFFDVWVTHPNAPILISPNLLSKFIKNMNSQEKKRRYGKHVLQVEKTSFCHFVYGGIGIESSNYHKRVARMIADKRNSTWDLH